jgi:hypothetical protein
MIVLSARSKKMADMSNKIRNLVRQESEARGAGFTSMASLPEVDMPEPYYPCVHLEKQLKGLDKVGKTVQLTVQARVKSIRQDEGEDPECDIELLAIKSDGEVTGFESSDEPIGIKENYSSNNNSVEDNTGWGDGE